MSKLHRAIMIDPEARRITELEIEITVAKLRSEEHTSELQSQ